VSLSDGRALDGRDLIDWDFALATARRLQSRGPQLPPAEARAVCDQLRELAGVAVAHVQQVTRLEPAADPGDVAVVDRETWVASNLAGFQVLAGPLLDKLAESGRRSNAVTLALGRRATGLQLGVMLAFLSSKVLGQYEVMLPDRASGRLSLIAPNIVAVERELGVVPRDFRLWVCLHEQCHRTQFTAVPWMRDHLESLITELAATTDLDPVAVLGRLRSAVAGMRDKREDGPRPGILELVQSPEQRAVLDRMQALMTLLEGHAEWAMDSVGPDVVPTVETIRGKFEERRGGGGVIDRLLRRVLGLDLKMQQYKQGAAFVRNVVAASGVTGLNTVWESPAALPTRAEISDPTAWMRRVLGSAATLPA
jgi:coenzyme F420 biosynthesis associated uncharacterized protein